MERDKAIAMANRIRCNEEKREKAPSVVPQGRPEIAIGLEKKMAESILMAKREHLAKIYGSYLDTYKGDKPEVTARITQIFSAEMQHIKDILEPSPRQRLKSPSCDTQRSSSIGVGVGVSVGVGVGLGAPKVQKTDWSPSPISCSDRSRSSAKLRDSRMARAAQEVKHVQELNVQEKEEFERKLECKMKVATHNRDALIQNRVQRLHVDHVLCLTPS